MRLGNYDAVLSLAMPVCCLGVCDLEILDRICDSGPDAACFDEVTNARFLPMNRAQGARRADRALAARRPLIPASPAIPWRRAGVSWQRLGHGLAGVGELA